MASNSFGTLFRFTTWGESHGPAIGVVIDGCPPLIPLSEEDIQPALDRSTFGCVDDARSGAAGDDDGGRAGLLGELAHHLDAVDIVQYQVECDVRRVPFGLGAVK